MPKRKSKDDMTILVQNIIKFCEEEKSAGKCSFTVEQVRARVAAMTGISARTIDRIRAKICESDQSQPSTSTNILNQSGEIIQKTRKLSIDDMDRCILRQKIHSMYVVEKTVPTLKLLHEDMTKETSFKGCKETLRKILLNMGYKFMKCQSNRKRLMERYDIVAWRARYLRFMKSNQEAEHSRPVVSIDETYVHKNYTVTRCWQSSTEEGVLRKDSAGQRWVLCHVGGSMGFIANALLLFKSKTKSGDYHDDMNYDNFSRWFQTVLIPQLPPNSIIVMDNAPYHSVQINKAPTAATKKAEIICWLQTMNIAYHPAMLKPELLELVKKYKPAPRYAIDEYAMASGHTVVRLPPYHCDLNPIEMIWSMVKRNIAAHNVDSLSNMEALIGAAFDSITPEIWQAECNHVKNIQQQYMERDEILDEQEETIIIQVSQSDTESEWSELSDD